ncbi:MAG TPA: DNA polymerase II large subunit [Nitrososphaeraceae archaeon]|nr:DNA polymerase II large subunit [Nitrososphaeraceae archaeon]
MINHFQFLDDNSITELRNLKSPLFYNKYHNDILESVNQIYLIANVARKQGIDTFDKIESRIVYDLADRVAKMHDINITNRLRDLLSKTTKEKAALKISEEIAQGEYSTDDLSTRLDNAVRVSLAIVTEGVTVAPLQGISDVQIKSNADGSQYLSVSFAGPIRSAGGTEAALTMLIADHVRKAVGLSKYQANSFDDETGRFVEELRIYEREVGNFQFKILDEDVIKCISNLPVELDGVDTDPVEIVGHRGMKRINTDRVRGGALRVMNDGLIGRSRKLLKIIDTLGLDGWDWLKELKGAIQKETSSEDDTVHHRMSEVITGRPVLSMSNKIGGFRLRYGRCYNTGFSTIGIHPTIPILLNYAIVVGTQIKIDTPGKAATIALVDSIEPPLVKLDDGTVTYVLSIEYAHTIQNRIDSILYLGDILISYGDFLENNAKLLPASYVEEIWALELYTKINTIFSNHEYYFTNDLDINKILEYIDKQRLFKMTNNPIGIIPTLKEAFLISKVLSIPLHPKYSFYWESISIDEIILLQNEFLKKSKSEIDKNNEIIFNKDNANQYYESFSIAYNKRLKDILERLGVIHSLKTHNNNSFIELTDTNQINSLYLLLYNQIKDPKKYQLNSSIDYIISISNILIKSKFSSSIAVRVGRPEKAAERKMKPPVHVLFPVGNKGGPTRDLLKASKEEILYTEIANRYCKICNLPSVGTKCRNCLSDTPMKYICKICQDTIRIADDDSKKEILNKCNKCKREGKSYSPVQYPLKKMLKVAEKILEIQSTPPLKGVKSLMGKNKSAEPLEKGILRQKYDLYAFKDGTIRNDATNEPLTHFKPKWIMTNITKLKELGYSHDFNGNDLSNEDQLLEIFIQDIILPIDTANHLLQVSKYIDKELLKLYKLKPFYNASNIDDLIGHIIVGLAPHTSVGIIGRIIGYTNSQVCLGSPMWHSAKRRDCDGDADSVMLLMDVFLNFSKEFLPDKIGGLMDAPLLIQPIVLPHEVQRQALNIDITSNYPLQLYEKSFKYIKAENLSNNIEIIKNRIGSELQFYNYYFTHHTDLLTTEEKRSAYSRLTTMNEKLEMQISTAKLINAVIPDEVASMVLTTHIIPDIMGNMRSYSSQAFRCTNCGEKYRRIPLAGKCLLCGNNLIQTVTRNSVEKYVYIALDIRNKFKMNDYLSSRIESLVMELNYVFKEKEVQKNPQSSIFDFIDQ